MQLLLLHPHELKNLNRPFQALTCINTLVPKVVDRAPICLQVLFDLA